MSTEKDSLQVEAAFGEVNNTLRDSLLKIAYELSTELDDPEVYEMAVWLAGNNPQAAVDPNLIKFLESTQPGSFERALTYSEASQERAIRASTRSTGALGAVAYYAKDLWRGFNRA